MFAAVYIIGYFLTVPFVIFYFLKQHNEDITDTFFALLVAILFSAIWPMAWITTGLHLLTKDL